MHVIAYCADAGAADSSVDAAATKARVERFIGSEERNPFDCVIFFVLHVNYIAGCTQVPFEV